MSGEDVISVIDAIEAIGVRVWIDGGWGVDALLGGQHRDHGDVDVVVELGAALRVLGALTGLGFSCAEDALPTRLVLRDARGRQIDVHPITFDSDGTGWQAGAAADGGDCPYPASGFVTGAITGRRVGCLSAEVQAAHHCGYEPSAADRHDMALLAKAFGVALPAPY